MRNVLRGLDHLVRSRRHGLHGAGVRCCIFQSGDVHLGCVPGVRLYACSRVPRQSMFVEPPTARSIGRRR